MSNSRTPTQTSENSFLPSLLGQLSLSGKKIFSESESDLGF
jgi:hypothetical protein